MAYRERGANTSIEIMAGVSDSIASVSKYATSLPVGRAARLVPAGTDSVLGLRQGFPFFPSRNEGRETSDSCAKDGHEQIISRIPVRRTDTSK